MANKAVPAGIVTFWNSALGHDLRDALVAFGSSLAVILLDWLSGVQLTGSWAQFAWLVPIAYTLVKSLIHYLDPNLPNLPQSPSS